MARNREELEIEIDETGRVTIHVHGIKGKDCVNKGMEVANIIGKVIEQSFTSEYYDPGSDVSINNTEKSRIR